MVYLDNQATTRCDPSVVEAMLPWFSENYGNAHSAEHAMGRAAEDAVEAARAQVASLIGAESREIVLTSGATESNNLAIKGAARHAAAQGGAARRIVTVASEHKCVLECARDLASEGFEPMFLPIGRDGLVDPDDLAAALRTPTVLVSVMTVNNETGVIQDISRLAALARDAGALFHTDAAQAAGKIPVSVEGVDLLSLSGHKMYGPKGIGALYVRRRPRVRLTPLFSGGGQERGFRSGTLPVPLAVGLGEAARLATARRADETARIAALRDRFWAALSRAVPGLVLNGHARARIAGNLNLTFPRTTAAELIRTTPGLCISTGSACSSAELEPSYVLTAMGLTADEAARTLRVGIGRFTSAADIDFAATALAAAHALVPAHAENDLHPA